MLTIEEIKQAVDEFNPNGFSITEGFNDNDYLSVENLATGAVKEFIYIVNLDTGTINNLPLYAHFLDWVMQGINRDVRGHRFIIYPDSIMYDCDSAEECEEFFDHDMTTEGIREACEKAIRFVLKEGV